MLVAVMVLPFAGCFWMIGESSTGRVFTEYDPELEIRNPNEGKYYTVNKVLDGNTIEVSDYSVPIQLLGVAAPGHSKEWNNFYTKDAYMNLKSMLEGKEICLYDDMFDEVPFRQWNGKVLAYVFLDGRLLNRYLIEQGYARVERAHTFNRIDEFLRAEERARANHAGLWAVQR